MSRVISVTLLISATVLLAVFGLGAFLEFGVQDSWHWKLAKRFWEMPEGIGALVGAFFALVAAIIAAVMNAQLNRDIAAQEAARKLQESEDSRNEERRVLAATILGDVAAIMRSTEALRDSIEQFARNPEMPKKFKVPELGLSQVFPVIASRIGLLGALNAEAVASFYGLMREVNIILGPEIPADAVVRERYAVKNLDLLLSKANELVGLLGNQAGLPQEMS
jgi:hypothetical protein